VACATADVAAATAASDTRVAGSASVSASHSVTQSNGTVSAFSSVQPAAGTCIQSGLIVTRNSTYWSILEKLCDELRLDPPRVIEVSKKSAECSATVSVKYGFPSSESHAKKANAQEDAAHVALLTLGEGDMPIAKNCRAQLNEYCQQRQCDKADYVLSESGPFNCTVFMPIVHSGLAPTEHEAKDKAARAVLSRLGRTSHLLRMFDDAQFESFCVSRKGSAFLLTARYRFARPAVGQRSKRDAEKIAAERALSVLYPDLAPKPALDNCKNRLQELYSNETPKYDTVPADDGLYYSQASVSFTEQTAFDNLSAVNACNVLAECALKRLALIS